jgi:putative tryptophan/tyrosine transport system substrate-binding protein
MTTFIGRRELGSPAAFAAKTTTTTIPVVFIVGSDPVTAGLVASINRPGGNLTGVSLFIGALIAKKLELLHELTPNTKVVAVLVNPKSPTAQTDASDMEAAGRSRGQQVHVLSAGDCFHDVGQTPGRSPAHRHRPVLG